MIQNAPSFSFWKVLGWAFAITGIISFILVPIINSVILGVKTGNWKPTIDSSLGLLFNTEKNIQDDVNILLSPLRDNFPRKFIEHIKSEIVFNLMVMVSWVIILHWLYAKATRKIIGEQVLNIGLVFIIFFLALLTVAIAVFLYPLAMPPHDFVIPFYGEYKLIRNPSIWSVIGSDVSIGSLFSNVIGSPIDVKDFTEDKPFDYNQIVEPNDKNVKIDVNILGRPKKTVEFYCTSNDECMNFFSNENAKCEASSGICYI